MKCVPLFAILLAATAYAGSPGVQTVPPPAPSIMVQTVDCPPQAQFTTQTIKMQVPKTVCVDQEYQETVMVPQTVTKVRKVPQTVMVEQEVQVQVPVPVQQTVDCVDCTSVPVAQTTTNCSCTTCTCVQTTTQCVDCNVQQVQTVQAVPQPGVQNDGGCRLFQRLRDRRADRKVEGWEG